MLWGTFPNGCHFYYIATHSGDQLQNPIFILQFENAVVEMKESREGQEITAYFKDGRIKSYGDAMSGESSASKISGMLAAIRGEGELTCPLESVIPALKVCNAVFDQTEIADMPDKDLFRSSSPAGTFMKGLSSQCLQCYEQMKLPDEMGYEWAQPEIRLELAGYDCFSGENRAGRVRKGKVKE